MPVPGVGEELGAEPMSPWPGPCSRSAPSLSVVDHLEHGALAQRQQLGDHAEILVGTSTLTRSTGS